MSFNYKNIVWDWNGTLIDDVNISIQSMNPLLKERNLPILNTETYKEVFTFPVKKYYENLGFDFSKEPFDKPALDFIKHYHKHLPKAGLFSDVVPTLKHFGKFGLKQMILSAMEEESLRESVKSFGISGYFNSIAGIRDHFAKSKIERGKKLFSEENITPDQTLFIGDTLHDTEVAKSLGCNCFLVSKGHQSIARLSENNTQVFANLTEIAIQISE